MSLSKQVLVAGAILVVISIAAGLFFFTRLGSQKENVSPIPDKENRSIQPSESLLEYADESGFSFSYPDNISLARQEVDDNAVYAQLALTSPDASGSILIRVADSTDASLASWMSDNKKLMPFLAAQKDVTLAGMKALQIKTNDSVITAALDQGVLFTIEVFPKKNEAYWLPSYAAIVESFAFASPPSTSASGQGAGGDGEVIFESEEIIE